MNSMCFKQLSPLIRLPLAQISPATRWMLLMYGTPLIYNALHHVVLKNIGKLP